VTGSYVFSGVAVTLVGTRRGWEFIYCQLITINEVGVDMHVCVASQTKCEESRQF